MRAIRRFTVRTVLPEPLAGLGELALNLRWSWHPASRDLFASVDPLVWEAGGHDPTALLGAVSAERLAELAADGAFRTRLADAVADLAAYVRAPRWYQQRGEDSPRAIAYFSPEFGITAVLPQYSGGLGILAGDHLKAASDLGVPIIGVGLLYRNGYFKQSLSREGWQLETYPLLDPNGLPISQLRDVAGEPVRISIALPGSRHLVANVWKAQVGRIPLLLLDSDVEENGPGERDVTDRLYGGGTEHRLIQEMLLGIGGVRAIRAFCKVTGHPAPEVWHTNEGHAGFLGVERIRELTEGEGLTFDAALEKVRAGTIFTTHTPVPAGFDRFPRELVAQHFSGDAASPGVPVERILALGAETYSGGDPNVFNMAVKGLRLAQRANGVSKLHGQVSRNMFAGLWPEFDSADVPIASITNGVHAPTWVDRELIDAAIRHLGPDSITSPRSWASVDEIEDAEVWAVRRRMREHLVLDARRRLRDSWVERGASEAELGWVSGVLDPDVLTIGFARRVPSYKRLTLMLRNPARLRKLLLDPDRPVQLVIAGKSHPADDGGKRLVQELVRFSDDPEVRHRIVFLPNYDMAMARTLYPGCDIWLNNPLRPLEACGTSGMKAALNGCLNLSVLDGWWDEWFDGQNGWAIPTADGVEDPDRRDDLESAALYDLVENSVRRLFYERDERGLPPRWLEMVKHTLRTLGPKVDAGRMVRDYVEQLYVPAAASARSLDNGHVDASSFADWKGRVRGQWSGVRIDHVESDHVSDSPELGSTISLRAFVSLGGLRPEDVDVQVLHGRVDTTDRIVDGVAESLTLAESYEAGRHRYEGDMELDLTGPFGYTVRVLPKHPQLASPAELGLIAHP